MADTRSLTPLDEADYDLIEAAVMETERGRWFLKEFGRRNRRSETQMLLEAMRRLEQVVACERVAPDVNRVRDHLDAMAADIARTKAEIAAAYAVERNHRKRFEGSDALDAITRQTGLAASDILAAAEGVRETAWTLREGGTDPALCDQLDRRASEIYRACSLQDLTSQRIAKVIRTLRSLEGRIDVMIALWNRPDGPVSAEGAPDLPEPASTPSPDDLMPSDMDSVIVYADLFAPPADPAVTDHLPSGAPPRLRLEAFADIDRLSTDETLRPFI